MSKLNDNEIKLKSNDQKRKRKNIKRGILGYPKKNRVLYFFNNRNNNVSVNVYSLLFFQIF
jgi:hypothetical protein